MVVDEPQEEEPPEEAEVKTSSSRGKERKSRRHGGQSGPRSVAAHPLAPGNVTTTLRGHHRRRRQALLLLSGPSDGAFMLGCNDGSACGDEWFHGRCVGVEEADEKAADEFVCASVERLGRMRRRRRFVSLWRLATRSRMMKIRPKL